MQRYQGLVDHRVKYTEEERKAEICLYLEGNGFRRTARILSELFQKNFCYRTIMQLVKNNKCWNLRNKSLKKQ